MISCRACGRPATTNFGMPWRFIECAYHTAVPPSWMQHWHATWARFGWGPR